MIMPGNSSVIQSQQILDHLVDGIIFSNQDGYISYANEAASALIGRPASEMVGHPITDILTRLPLLASSAGGGPRRRLESPTQPPSSSSTQPRADAAGWRQR